MRIKNIFKNKYKSLLLKHVILPLIILMAVCILSVGYGALNTSLMIEGNVSADLQKGVFITNVSFNEEQSNNVDISENSNVTTGTFFSGNVKLTDNLDSKLVYNITVYNNSNDNATFKEVIGELDNKLNINNNGDIEYEVSISQGTVLPSKESMTFTLTYKYKDDITQITNNMLTSCIRFKFEYPVYRFDLSEIVSGGAFILGEGENPEERTLTFNANSQTFYVEMDVTNATANNENLISIGEYISEWDIPASYPGAMNLHIYYPSQEGDGKIVIAPIIEGVKWIQFKTSYSRTESSNIMKIAFNVNGLYINGEKVLDKDGLGSTTVFYKEQEKNSPIDNYIQALFNRLENGVDGTGNLTVQIGSTQGTTRSRAQYTAVEIHQQTMSASELIELTLLEETPIEQISYSDYLTTVYSPNGQKFIITERPLNKFNEQTLYVEIDLSSIPSGRLNENILSIGHEIDQWQPLESNKANLHLYYPNSNGDMILSACLRKTGEGDNQWIIPKSLLNLTDGILKIAINSHGLFINGECIFSNVEVNSSLVNFEATTGLTVYRFLQVFLDRLRMGVLDIGSQEGGARSYAQYNVIRVYDGIVSVRDLIELTSVQ